MRKQEIERVKERKKERKRERERGEKAVVRDKKQESNIYVLKRDITSKKESLICQQLAAYYNFF
jgi:hypothetical protein